MAFWLPCLACFFSSFLFCSVIFPHTHFFYASDNNHMCRQCNAAVLPFFSSGWRTRPFVSLPLETALPFFLLACQI